MPETIRGFAERVQSPERLKLLLILTVADIRAVGPACVERLEGDAAVRALSPRARGDVGRARRRARGVRIKAKQEAVRTLLKDFTDAEFDAFLARTYPSYWLSSDAPTLARQGRLTREAERSGAPLTVDTRVDTARAVTEITLYTADHPGLFSRIAGALALAGANIVDAKILTLANGMALDTFLVQDQRGGAFDRPEKLAKLAVLFENVLSGRVKPHLELKEPSVLASRTRIFAVLPRVLINNTASRTPHGDRGQRPRPAGAAVRADPRADPAQSADRERENLHLWREGGGRLLCQGSVRPQGRARGADQGDPRETDRRARRTRRCAGAGPPPRCVPHAAAE